MGEDGSAVRLEAGRVRSDGRRGQIRKLRMGEMGWEQVPDWGGQGLG